MKRALYSTVLLTLLLTACDLGLGDALPRFTAPTIATFTASESTISAGENTTLNWQVSGSSPITLTLLPGIGDVTGRSSVTVNPTETTEYMLIANNNRGTRNRSLVVEVSGQSGEPAEKTLTYRNIVLSGENEVPPIETSAYGTASATLIGDTLTVNGNFYDLEGDPFPIDGSPSHIHFGKAGKNGDIFFALNVKLDEGRRSGSFTGEQTLTVDEIATLEAGGYYINFHTDAFNGGELRGQLSDDQPSEDDVTYEVELAGSSEVPSVDTDASGSATATLEGNTLNVTGDFDDLSSDLYDVDGSPAHIHVGDAGENGPIAFPLEVSADDDAQGGSFSLTQRLSTDEQAVFRAGGYYINVHTENYQDGELRAQLSEAEPSEPEEPSEPGDGENEEPDVTATFTNVGTTAWQVTSVEGADDFAETGEENAALQLEVGTRYQFDLSGVNSDVHPFELNGEGDENLLLAQNALTGSFEDDDAVNFQTEDDYIIFTLTAELADELQRYNCGVHTGSMRGDISVSGD